MAKTLVDTNVLVAFYNETDALHEKAQKGLGLTEKPLFVHEYVAIESINVLMSRVSKAAADDLIDTFLNNADYELILSSENTFLTTSNEFTQGKSKQLSFVDSCLLTLSNEYEVLTFDDALNRAIKKRLA
jgi:predicted nucleic acid-binding protein